MTNLQNHTFKASECMPDELVIPVRVVEKELHTARIDWLRSEIEKLEGIDVDCKHEDGHDKYQEYCAMYGGTCKHQGYNQLKTSIITRYKEELLELEKEV